MKALVGAFNQEKALVGAFSVIVKTGCGTDGSFYSTIHYISMSRREAPGVYSVARVARASRRPGHSAAPPLAWSTCSSARVSPDTEGNIVHVKVATRFRGYFQYM